MEKIKEYVKEHKETIILWTGIVTCTATAVAVSLKLSSGFSSELETDVEINPELEV